MQQLENTKIFSGHQQVWSHHSTALNCPMQFAIYLPEQAATQALPVLYWLSGLTCTEQNFITKSGFQRYAAEHNVIVVAPDTSPRGADVADDAAYDLGQGAGFYVNATQAPWVAHYRMYDYVVHELPSLVAQHFNVTDKKAVCGHSMGGHGALVMALRESGAYTSVSAFAPIVAPSQVPWGQKAFTAYLGDNREAWLAYDASHLVEQHGAKLPMRIDQGSADKFLAEQLRPELFAQACQAQGVQCAMHHHEGYDHSYYFIASFIGEHIAFHAQHLHA